MLSMNSWNELVETAIVPGTCLRRMAKKAKGHIQRLPSGSLRVKVGAGPTRSPARSAGSARPAPTARPPSGHWAGC